MLDIELNGTEPKHVERIKPSMSTGASGEINWTPSLLDYDAQRFFRGKQVTNEEFNELFLKQLYQGNYIADSLTELFKNHLGSAIYRTFTHTFNLKKSYTKVFTPADWGNAAEDGYYYIDIPAEEHGFLQNEGDSDIDNMNIDTEMYVLSPNGQFHEVMQVLVDLDNSVRLYTDDNALSGFVVVRSNDKSFRLADDTEIDASDVKGLHPVAVSGRYQDLEGLNAADGPTTLINNLHLAIVDILEGNVTVAKAQEATHANTATALLLEGTIQGIPVSNIFEAGSSYVKNATHANQADSATNANQADNATHANQADSATNANKATNDSAGNNIVNTYSTKNSFNQTLTPGDSWDITTPGLYSVCATYNSTPHWCLIEVDWLSDDAYGPMYRTEEDETIYAVYSASSRRIYVVGTNGDYGKDGIRKVIDYSKLK